MKRIIQLDFFRGLFLVVITINHFLSNDNIIKKFTNEFIGWMTAAEGFVFLSGFTVGLIYTYYFREKGEQFVKVASYSRAWLIYKIHLALFLLAGALLLTVPYLSAFWTVEYSTIQQEPALATLLGTFLLYQPPLLDILPMYAVFMLLVPIIIKNITKGRPWQVFCASFAVYLIGTFMLAEPGLNWQGWGGYIFLGVFNPLCWQFLFVGGLLVSYLFQGGKIRQMQKQTILLYGALAVSFVLFGMKQLHLTIDGLDILYWTDKEHLRPIRLLNFISLTTLMTFIVFRYKDQFTFRPFCYLGKYSLHVFAAHIILVLTLSPWRIPLNKVYKVGVLKYYIYPLETLLLLFIILSLFLVPTLVSKLNFKKLLFNQGKKLTLNNR